MAPGTLTLIFKFVPSDCTTTMTLLENCTPKGNSTSTPWQCHKLSSLNDALKCTGTHSSCLLPDAGSLSSLGGRPNSASFGFVFGAAQLIRGPKLSNLGSPSPSYSNHPPSWLLLLHSSWQPLVLALQNNVQP